MKRFMIAAAVLTIATAPVGCSSKKGTGALIGAGSGGAVGAIIGKQAGNTAVGALIGAAVGGAAGAYIGSQMDKQAAEIEQDIAGARVERVGEGIKITFDSGIMFDVGKAALRPEAQTNLTELARILNKYPDTNILIEGHTDATGSEEMNLTLSQQRAQSVASTLGRGVDPSRFTIIGYGEAQPVASNETDYGRQQNRRVELAIMANEKLKKAAQRQAQG